MTCGRVAAAIAAVALLFPGLCFLVFGVYGLGQRSDAGMGFFFIVIALGIFVLAGWVVKVAFRKHDLDSDTVVKIRRPTESEKPEPPKDA